MTEFRRLSVARGSELKAATVAYHPAVVGCHVDLQLDDGRTLMADGGDYFECLVAVRHRLEREGALLLCQGARRNVWPSGMARSMGAGLKAYVLVNGRPPTTDDLVEIFDPAERDDVGTVAEQERARDEWFASRDVRVPNDPPPEPTTGGVA